MRILGCRTRESAPGRNAIKKSAAKCGKTQEAVVLVSEPNMKALVLKKPGQASIETVPDPVLTDGEILLKVRMVGFCGSDLNSFRGLNPLVSYPRILGHEVSATVLEGASHDSALSAGTDVALFPYTNCGTCSSCRRGRPNACQFNQ